MNGGVALLAGLGDVAIPYRGIVPSYGRFSGLGMPDPANVFSTPNQYAGYYSPGLGALDVPVVGTVDVKSAVIGAAALLLAKWAWKKYGR